MFGISHLTRTFRTAVMCLSVLLARASAGASEQFTLTDLGTLGESYSQALAINDSGQVVGDAFTPGDAANSVFLFLYSGGTITNLGIPLGGSGFSQSLYGINNSGQVVGGTYPIPYTGEAPYRAFLYSGGAMTNLGSLGGRYGYSQASGINDSGQVVGYSSTDSDNHAFLYNGGAMTDLGTLGGRQSEAYGINNSGQVVGGAATTGDTAYHAFLYDGSTMTDLNSMISPSSGWTLDKATAINDSGQIVGNSSTDSDTHAFLYSGGAMTDLGTLGGSQSEATGMRYNRKLWMTE
ncbi:MAG: DUF3466 family protein [Phycisphaerales bacterium]